MRLAPRDTWPSVEIGVELLPWQWHRWWLYRDDIDPFWVRIDVGPFRLVVMANLPLFYEPELETEAIQQPWLRVVQ